MQNLIDRVRRFARNVKLLNQLRLRRLPGFSMDANHDYGIVLGRYYVHVGPARVYNGWRVRVDTLGPDGLFDLNVASCEYHNLDTAISGLKDHVRTYAALLPVYDGARPADGPGDA